MGLAPMLFRAGWLRRIIWPLSRRAVFREVFPLRDEELELVAPSRERLDALMDSIRDPATRRDAPELTKVSRSQMKEFLASNPGGRQHKNAGDGVKIAYHFWLINHNMPNLPVAGSICLRIGRTEDIERYFGHFGYHVYPAHRGRHFAERAVRLLLPLARDHGIDPVWITCNPGNYASRRTCTRLGAKWVDTVDVPIGHPLALKGEIVKCRYRLDVARVAT